MRFISSKMTCHAGGQAELEERQVSSRVSLWKRFDEDSLWMCLRMFTKICHLVKSAHSVCYINCLSVVHGCMIYRGFIQIIYSEQMMDYS